MRPPRWLCAIASGKAFDNPPAPTSCMSRIGLAATQACAAVDDFLGAALNFGVGALHRSEIQIRGTLSAAHRGGRSAAQADQHRRPAQNDERRTDDDVLLLHVGPAHIAEAPGDHDGLVVAANHGAPGFLTALLESSEISAGIRAAELIVECGGSQGRGNHDVERRGDAFRFAEVLFPRLLHAGNSQIRYREPRESRLRLCADARRTLIADLPARAGGGTGERRNRSRMIVRLHLHQDIDGFFHPRIAARRRDRRRTASRCRPR